MNLAHWLLLLFWGLFCFLHSWLAHRPVRSRLEGASPLLQRHYRLLYTLFAGATFLAVVVYQVLLPSPFLYRPSNLTYVIGGLVCLSGLALMGICIRKYFRNLSGIRSLVEEAPPAELEVTGVHRFIRHPLYLGTFAAIWGAWISFPLLSLLLSNLLITGYTVYALRFEEAKLIADFGDQYRRYQRQVPALLPRRLK